jgi:hypothetical protein
MGSFVVFVDRYTVHSRGGIKVSVLAYTVASVETFFMLVQETDNLNSCSTNNVS